MHKIIPNIFTFISSFNKEEILKLNKNIGIIFRNYNENHNKDTISRLRNFCKKHKRRLYLSNNLKLAINLNLDGAYIPSFNKDLDVKKYKIKNKFLLLGSAHNIQEIKIKEKQGVDVIFLAPLFKTKNKIGLGINKFNILSKLSIKKIVALGGINKKNIYKLNLTDCYGFAGISYFKNVKNEQRTI